MRSSRRAPSLARSASRPSSRAAAHDAFLDRAVREREAVEVLGRVRRRAARSARARPPAGRPRRRRRGTAPARSTGTLGAHERRGRQLHDAAASAARGTPRRGSCPRSSRRCASSCRTPAFAVRSRRSRAFATRRVVHLVEAELRLLRDRPVLSARRRRRTRAAARSARRCRRGGSTASSAGRSAARSPKPRSACVRKTCFMCTVSPARKQRAVEDRCARAAPPSSVVRRQLEAPRLDAVVPARVHEAQVVAAPRGDEQPVVQLAQRRRLRAVEEVDVVGSPLPEQLGSARAVGQVGDARDALRVGRALPEHRAVAVARPRPARPRPACASSSVVTQTSDCSAPHLKCTERLVTSAAVGTYIGCGLLEQRRAEPRALELDDVEPGLRERDADHLEGALAARLRQRERRSIVPRRRPSATGRRVLRRVASARSARAKHRRVALRDADAAEPRQDVGLALGREPHAAAASTPTRATRARASGSRLRSVTGSVASAFDSTMPKRGAELRERREARRSRP